MVVFRDEIVNLVWVVPKANFTGSASYYHGNALYLGIGSLVSIWRSNTMLISHSSGFVDKVLTLPQILALAGTFCAPITSNSVDLTGGTIGSLSRRSPSSSFAAGSVP